MKSNIAFIAYFFSENDGVGSSRSRTLAQTLAKRENQLDLINKNSFGVLSNKFFFIWCLNCFWKVIRNRYDKVYVSCGPFTHLPFILIACILSRNNFVIDFRDPWSFNIKTGYGNPDLNASKIKIWTSEFIEKISYKYCDYFWVCTPGMYDSYSKLFQENSKLILVANGYSLSKEDIFQDENLEKDDKDPRVLSFVCLGNFALKNEPITNEYAYKLLSEIKEYMLIHGEDSVKIEFIGTELEPTKSIINELGLENVTVFTPKMNYIDAMKKASSFDVGLFVSRNPELELGTKPFDYIGLGIPIYNIFEEDSNLNKYFKKYLTKTKRKFINLEDKKSFRRQYIFEKYASMIDGRDKRNEELKNDSINPSA